MTDTRDRTIVLATMMQPAQANPRGTVHGGEIMKMMDTTAGGAAIRYSKMDMVTARVDELQFLEPIHIADYVTCVAQVVYVGRTSLEVYVTVDVENLRGGVTKRALDAY
ncbi:MAG: acyl-CoA thioesterase, partial [Propionibacteriaceae bacterium]|nr:acyl-CoA thioesterase [Propionibacteriaceae bacterium]